jgi:hypothetical protein
MPAGALVTVPTPVPDLPTVSVYNGNGWNAAVTDLAAIIGMVHVAVVPVHAPDQPLNTDPAEADAVNTTLVPDT